jgi:hypothetical protein
MMHESDTFDTHAPADDPYSTFSIDDQVVLYDAENADCWLQSDTTVELAEAV